MYIDRVYDCVAQKHALLQPDCGFVCAHTRARARVFSPACVCAQRRRRCRSVSAVPAPRVCVSVCACAGYLPARTRTPRGSGPLPRSEKRLMCILMPSRISRRDRRAGLGKTRSSYDCFAGTGNQFWPEMQGPRAGVSPVTRSS